MLSEISMILLKESQPLGCIAAESLIMNFIIEIGGTINWGELFAKSGCPDNPNPSANLVSNFQANSVILPEH